MVKASVRDGKIADWRHGVASYLGALAVETLACPSGDILAHGWPYDLCSDGLTRTLDAGVSKAMDNVEDGLAESQWNEWPGWAIADVYN